ncbi:MAG: hypothetical protein ACKO5X_09910, partial [Limnohabitans sp.]
NGGWSSNSGDSSQATVDAPRPSTYSGPSQGMRHALLDSDPADRILIFGSFFTVGEIMLHGIEGRLPAALTT